METSKRETNRRKKLYNKKKRRSTRKSVEQRMKHARSVLQEELQEARAKRDTLLIDNIDYVTGIGNADRKFNT